MKIQHIFVIGDVHGEWGSFNSFITRKIKQNKNILNDIEMGHEVEVIILQCGDFGFWPHFDKTTEFSGGRKIWDQWGIKHHFPGIVNNTIKIIWCAGNHENHDVLDNLETSTEENFIEIDPIRAPNIFYATFGSVYTLLDNSKVLFCGGASSIDKALRIPGISWWAGETISNLDMYKLPKNIEQIDIVISHTCPKCFDHTHNFLNMVKCHDPSKLALDTIFDTYKPRKWFYGHYHRFSHAFIKQCETFMLDRIDGSNGKCFINWRLTSENITCS